MKMLLLFVGLCLYSLSLAQTTFTHITSEDNVDRHITTISSPATNGISDAILIVNQLYGKYNEHEIGVWFSDGKWKIFNQDRSPMPLGTKFNVLVFDKTQPNVLVHETKNTNVRGHITQISSPLTDGKPKQLLFVTQQYGRYNTSPVGTWYSNGVWNIYNERTSEDLPIGTKFNVYVVSPQNANGRSASTFETETNDHIAKIPRMATTSKENFVFVTPNWKSKYNPEVTGVWFDGTEWTVYNQNKSKMENGVRYNVLELSPEHTESSRFPDNIPQIPSPIPGNSIPYPSLPSHNFKVNTTTVKLPFLENVETVNYIVKDNLAIFEGDIILGESGEVDIPTPPSYPPKKTFTEGTIAPSTSVGSVESGLNRRQADGIFDRDYLWKNGVIPYEIKADDFSASEVETIQNAIRDLSARTNLNIVPKWKIQNHVVFVKDEDLNGGSSRVGRCLILQRIRLGNNPSLSVVQHELLHAAGFWHEQSRNDRDRYITINWDNIADGQEHNFEKHVSDGFNVTPYDINSIMHYGGFAFSVDPSQPTIVDNRTSNPVQGSGQLSPMDIDGINLVYPYDYYERLSRPITTLRHVKLRINRVQSDDKDGGSKQDIDFYLKSEIGSGWNWRPGNSTNSSRKEKTGVLEQSGNDIQPNWVLTYPVQINETKAKIWMQLRDDDGRSGTEGGVSPDETIDINPYNGISEVELFIDLIDGSIYMGDIDGVPDTETVLGEVGENIELEGFDHVDIRSYINFTVLVE